MSFMTWKPLVDISVGHPNGTMQKETRFEDTKGRITGFVMERAIKDRSISHFCLVWFWLYSLCRHSLALGKRGNNPYPWLDNGYINQVGPVPVLKTSNVSIGDGNVAFSLVLYLLFLVVEY